MPAIVTCPKCQTKYQLADAAMGSPIKCKKCETVFRTKAPATAAAPETRPAPQQRVANPDAKASAGGRPQPSANELAQFGLDGPLRRQAADVFAGTQPLSQRGPDILGNHAVEPGFADVPVADLFDDEDDAPATNDYSDIINNPYLAPSPISKSGSGGKGKQKSYTGDPNYQFKSAKLLAILTTTGIVLAGLLAFAIPIYGMLAVSTISSEDIESGEAVGTAFVWGIPFLLMIIGLVSLLLFNFVMLLIFMYRANANVRALGASGLEVSPGWSVGWWFIPFANLYKPCQSMGEIYRASIRPRGSSWSKMGFPGLVGVWWAMVIINRIVSSAGSVVEDLDQNLLSILAFADAATMAIYGILLIIIMFKIVNNQAKHV